MLRHHIIGSEKTALEGQTIDKERENFIWGVHIDPSMEETKVKLQVGHNDFKDTWFNPDGSTLSDNPDGTEVSQKVLQSTTLILVIRLS